MRKSFLGDIPGAIFQSQAYAPAHAAATATEQVPIFTAAQPLRVRRVSFTPAAAATGDNSNTTNLNVINRGAAGAGTTEIGSFDPVTGADLVAGDEKNVFAPVAASGYITLAAGDVLAAQYEKVGSGLAISQGVWTVEYDLAT